MTSDMENLRTMVSEVEEEGEHSDSSGALSGDHPRVAEQGQEGLHAKETRLVNRSKILVYVFLLISAGAFGTASYFFLEEQEKIWWQDEVRQTNTF